KSSSLRLSVIDKDGRSLDLATPSLIDDLQVSRVVLPDEGDYRIRVTGRQIRDEYTLMISRVGLSEEGYQKRLRQSYDDIAVENRPDFYDALNVRLTQFRSVNQPDAHETFQKIRAAAATLEQLISLVPGRHEAYGRLAAIYLYHLRDLDRSFEFAQKSLELGGEAVFKVKYGTKSGKKLRELSSDKKLCWLRIKNGSALCERIKKGKETAFSTTPELLKNESLNVSGFDLGLKIKGLRIEEDKKEKKKDFYLVPLSVRDLEPGFAKSEVNLIKSLIKRFVQNGPRITRIRRTRADISQG